MLDMESKFAPAYRLSREEVVRELQHVIDTEYVDTILNGLPYIAAVLNQQRQVVFANKVLLETINLNVLSQMLGDRPGEILQCVNSKKEIGGCGTSENCKYCGAVKTILKCQTNLKAYTDECRIISNRNGYDEAFDFKVTSSPLIIKNQQFIIFTLLDISAEKRKMVLEKIFFHDVINKAGSLQGFIDLIKSVKEEKKIDELLTVMQEISVELTQEILNQREIISAENGELKVRLSEVSTSDVISSVTKQMQNHEVSNNRIIEISKDLTSHLIKTDVILLKRILINMLKNALEATNENGRVSIGCKRPNGKVVFWVHNRSLIPRASQLQIFQRSFSTKAKNRGLGTYSMKLLGERYLKGKVYFTSTESEGTKFYLDLPI